MKINQAFRYELDPNDAQRTLLHKHAGAARYVYNWALGRRIEMFEKNEGKAKFTNAIQQHRELNGLKRTELPWLYETSKCAPQEALRDLDRAFKAFWDGRKKGRRIGFPKFRKKGVQDRFRLTGSIRIDGPRHVVLPRIGRVRVKENTGKFRGRILSATIKRKADRWFVSFSVERERPDPQSVNGVVVGVDLGLTNFAVQSDGMKIDARKPLKAHLERLRRLSKAHSRKQKGSNNRRNSAMRLARLHMKIENIRTDWIHKATTALAKAKSVIVVEDLVIQNLNRNRRLSRSIADAGWGEYRRQLGYKTRWYGSELVVAPRNFPSTRRCSGCGIVGPRLELSCRVFRCPACGFSSDRDLNSAKNLEWYGQFGRNLKPVESPLSAERIPGAERSTRHGSTKQEANAISSCGING